jgi:hypothetical protein
LDYCPASLILSRNSAAGISQRYAEFFAKQGIWVTGN